jgi:hypothetical protein
MIELDRKCIKLQIVSSSHPSCGEPLIHTLTHRILMLSGLLDGILKFSGPSLITMVPTIGAGWASRSRGTLRIGGRSWRGQRQDSKAAVDCAPDFESYDYTKLDVFGIEPDKTFFEGALAWDLEVDSKKWADGKNVSVFFHSIVVLFADALHCSSSKCHLTPSTPLSSNLSGSQLSGLSPSPLSLLHRSGTSLSPMGAAGADGFVIRFGRAAILTAPPKLVVLVETPDVAVEAVDPTKRWVVTATRFSS